jgi:hypothetical protein
MDPATSRPTLSDQDFCPVGRRSIAPDNSCRNAFDRSLRRPCRRPSSRHREGL